MLDVCLAIALTNTWLTRCTCPGGRVCKKLYMGDSESAFSLVIVHSEYFWNFNNDLV